MSTNTLSDRAAAQDSASTFDAYSTMVEQGDRYVAWTNNGLRRAMGLQEGTLKWKGTSSNLSILHQRGYTIRLKRYPQEGEGQGRDLYVYVIKKWWNKIKDDPKVLAVLQALPASAFPVSMEDINNFWDVHGVKGLPYRGTPGELRRFMPNETFGGDDFLMVQRPTIATARTEVAKEESSPPSVAGLKAEIETLKEENWKLQERLEAGEGWDGVPVIEWRMIESGEDVRKAIPSPGTVVMAAYVCRWEDTTGNVQVAGTCPARIELFKLGATREEMLATRDIYGIRPLKWQHDTYWMTPWFDPNENERGVLNWQVLEYEDEHAPILSISFYAIATADPPMPPKPASRPLTEGVRYEVSSYGLPGDGHADHKFVVWLKSDFAVVTWKPYWDPPKFKYIASSRTISPEDVQAYMLLPEEE